MLGALIILAVVALGSLAALIFQARQHSRDLLLLQQAHTEDFGSFVSRVVSTPDLAIAEPAPTVLPRQERTYFSDDPYDDAAWNEHVGEPNIDNDPRGDFDQGAE